MTPPEKAPAAHQLQPRPGSQPGEALVAPCLYALLFGIDVMWLGHRNEGFRLWTGQSFNLPSARAIRLDVVTEGGQLIGRASLPVIR